MMGSYKPLRRSGFLVAALGLLGVLAWVAFTSVVSKSDTEEPPARARVESDDISITDPDCVGCRVMTGLYENARFGFRIRIPTNWVGLAEPSGLPDRGVMIKKQDNGFHTKIYVTGQYNAGLVQSTEKATEESLGFLFSRQWIEQVRVVKRDKSILGGMTANRFVVQYLDTKTNTYFVEDHIITLKQGTETDASDEVIYEITLVSPAETYSTNTEYLQGIVESFQRF